MYEIACEECGWIGVHASRTGAEGQAERHIDETGHGCEITPM
jgi:hypothetical protein